MQKAAEKHELKKLKINLDTQNPLRIERFQLFEISKTAGKGRSVKASELFHDSISFFIR
jgi:hypothetical protein